MRVLVVSDDPLATVPTAGAATVFSTVMDLHDRTMLVAAGNPCTEPFTRVRLDG